MNNYVLNSLINELNFIKSPSDITTMFLVNTVIAIVILFTVFIPSIILIIVIKKFIKSSNPKLVYLINTFTISLSMGLCYFLLFVLDYRIDAEEISTFLIFGLFPIALVSFFLLTIIKKKNYSYLLAAYILVSAFICILTPLGQKLDDRGYVLSTAYHATQKYSPIIKELEYYKKKNGIYPQSIKSIKLPDNTFYPEYACVDECKSMTFRFSNQEMFGDTYIYCSDKKDPQCIPRRAPQYQYVKRGDWTFGKYAD